MPGHGNDDESEKTPQDLIANTDRAIARSQKLLTEIRDLLHRQRDQKKAKQGLYSPKLQNLPKK